MNHVVWCQLSHLSLPAHPARPTAEFWRAQVLHSQSKHPPAPQPSFPREQPASAPTFAMATAPSTSMSVRA